MITALRDLDTMMSENLLVKHYAGSHSYGMALPTSDVDFRGIFVADPLYVRTPFYQVGEVNDTTEEDTVIYELNKFMKLALDNNPNVIETLWVDQRHVVHDTPAYQLLRSHAGDFLTSKIAMTTSGYAIGQLKRLQHSKKKVNYLPDLDDLCSLLVTAIADGIIDIDFINHQCGEHVLTYMTDTGYLT